MYIAEIRPRPDSLIANQRCGHSMSVTTESETQTPTSREAAVKATELEAFFVSSGTARSWVDGMGDGTNKASGDESRACGDLGSDGSVGGGIDRL